MSKKMKNRPRVFLQLVARALLSEGEAPAVGELSRGRPAEVAIPWPCPEPIDRPFAVGEFLNIKSTEVEAIHGPWAGGGADR